jgi:hypothetical protein
VIAAQPELRDIFPMLIVGDFRRIDMAVVINDRLVFRVIMKKPPGFVGIEKKIGVNKGTWCQAQLLKDEKDGVASNSGAVKIIGGARYFTRRRQNLRLTAPRPAPAPLRRRRCFDT